MAIIFISALFIAFSLQFFTLNYQIQGCNRELINTPIQYVALAIRVHDDRVYLDREQVIHRLSVYYNDQLWRYCNSYEVSFYFFNKDDRSYCMKDYCYGVEVTLDCSLISNYHFTKSMTYVAKDGIYGQD